ETGTEGCFIRDSVSDQRLFQVVWSPDREGWLLSDRDVKAHYFVTRSFYLASLCGSVNTSLDSELFHALPDAVSWCQKCWDRKLIRSEKATSVATHPKIASVALPSLTFSVSSPSPEVKRGLPVYESEIRGEKLERRDIIVSRGDDQLKLSIDVLRAQHRAGLFPADLPVLVTTFSSEATYYCDDGTVGSVVSVWE